ncbi:SRPBCC family protein [Nocardioides sp.]|uniref:SRPBCC family protein n=1 Tax=Nocardioides sp. TaxID=35761 RepID=UPI0035273D6D
MSWQRISVERVIPAPPESIFALLADPAGHLRIDGSGSVQAARSGARRLQLGDRFGMDMRLGVAYSTRNVVTEFEENRLIAWRTLAAGPLSHLFTGRTWRYELEPVDGGTRVRETWDLSTEKLPSRLPVRLAMGSMTRDNMTRTLERIAEVVAEPAG